VASTLRSIAGGDGAPRDQRVEIDAEMAGVEEQPPRSPAHRAAGGGCDASWRQLDVA
jgi:hypothetical protein